MAYNSTRDIIYFSEAAHDGTATGDDYLTTVRPSGAPVHSYPFVVMCHVIDEDNVLTPAVISVGTNSPNYNNIVNAQSVGGAVGVTVLPVVSQGVAIDPETDLRVNVVVAAIPTLLQTPTLNFKVSVHVVEI